MSTTRLTVNLPESEINFLKQYAKKNQTTIPQLFNRWIKNLKTQSQLHPDIKRFTGIIPEDVDLDQAITDHLMEKHK